MLFSSITFLFFFLVITLGLYYLVPWRVKNYVLLVASLLFYAAGEPKYIFLLLFAALNGWAFGLLMEKYPKRKILLLLAVVINLGLLVYYKYTDFLLGSANRLFHWDIPLMKIALPIGISFFTFQNLSYMIDVYRGDHKAERSPFAYATYLTLFPQLIAGPIVRYVDVARELKDRTITTEAVSKGIVRFAVGLGKKVLLANAMGQLAELTIPQGSVVFSWLQAIAFTLQIYFDFSGYSDMAIGMGSMMGFVFLENFNYPYLSRSVTEFWRRWHMSLGTWFRDYVYIPLGGNRTDKKWKWLRNVLIVWMLTGIWHGANWNFLLWGLFYGIMLLVEKLWLGKYLNGKVLPHVYTLLATVLGFVLFNSNTGMEAIREIGRMFGLGSLPLCNEMTLYYLRSYAVLLVICCVGSTPLLRNLALRIRDTRAAVVLQPVFVLVMLVLVTACLVDGSFNPFLYFRF